MARSNMLFDVLENILKTKSIDIYEQHIQSDNFKDASPYMIRKYLTMHVSENVRNIVLDNYLSLEQMPAQILYRWLIDNVPQQRQTFIRYIK